MSGQGKERVEWVCADPLLTLLLELRGHGGIVTFSGGFRVIVIPTSRLEELNEEKELEEYWVMVVIIILTPRLEGLNEDKKELDEIIKEEEKEVEEYWVPEVRYSHFSVIIRRSSCNPLTFSPTSL